MKESLEALGIISFIIFFIGIITLTLSVAYVFTKVIMSIF